MQQQMLITSPEFLAGQAHAVAASDAAEPELCVVVVNVDDVEP